MSKTEKRRITVALTLQAVVCVLFLMQFVHLLGVSLSAGTASYGSSTPVFLTALAGAFLVLSVGSMAFVAARARRS